MNSGFMILGESFDNMFSSLSLSIELIIISAMNGSNKKGLDYSLGISRNKTDIFNEYKDTAMARRHGRFKKRFDPV